MSPRPAVTPTIWVKDYDFTAPLGAFGQVRERYHRLRLQHLFLHDFGEQFARSKE